MRFYDQFIKASSSIDAQQVRMRAEILTCLVMFRGLAFLVLLVAGIIYDRHVTQILLGVSTLNLLSYFISRTRLFRIAALIVIIEPILAMPTRLVQDFAPSMPITGATVMPMWLMLGPILSALVLSARTTALVFIATFISFGVILYNAGPEFKEIVSYEFCLSFVVCIVAPVGTYLWKKSDETLLAERAKVLQSSKLASLGEMAAGVAHELNSPLASISLSAEILDDMLTEGDLEGAAVEAKSIGETVDRMATIINGLRTFSRDARDEQLTQIPVSKWVSDSLRLCEQRFKNSSIEVKVEQNRMNEILSVRPVQLSQVLLNLLNNSFDAVSETREKWISIEARLNQNYFEVTITDSGSGLRPDQAERIFEPFFTTKGVGRGTGLGLSISKGIMQSHGGDLVYDASCPNTRFVLRLPFAETKAIAA